MELASVKQYTEERFCNFEIRLRKLLNFVLGSSLSREEIDVNIFTKRVRNTGFRDSLTSKPNTTVKNMLILDKVNKNREQSPEFEHSRRFNTLGNPANELCTSCEVTE